MENWLVNSFYNIHNTQGIFQEEKIGLLNGRQLSLKPYGLCFIKGWYLQVTLILLAVYIVYAWGMRHPGFQMNCSPDIIIFNAGQDTLGKTSLIIILFMEHWEKENCE